MTFFKVFLKFKTAATDQVLFFGGRKNLIFFLNFNITFLATWGCASDFSKMLSKLKMAASGQHQFFYGRENSKTLSRKLFKLPAFPTIWRCASDFFKALLKLKMAAMDKLFFVWRKN